MKLIPTNEYGKIYEGVGNVKEAFFTLTQFLSFKFCFFFHFKDVLMTRVHKSKL